MRLLKWFFGIIIILGLLVGLSPLLVKAYIDYRLESKGYEVEIKKLGIDLIFGQVSVHGVKIKSPNNEQLNIFEGVFEFDRRALFQKTFRIDHAELKDFHLDLNVQNEQITFAGLSFDQWMPLAKKNSWPLDLRYIQFTNSELCRIDLNQCLNVASASASKLKITANDQGYQVEHSSPVSLNKAYLRDNNSELSIFYLDEFKIGEGLYTPSLRQLKNIELNNFQLVESRNSSDSLETPYQTQVGELDIDSLLVDMGSSPRVNLGEVELISLRQALHKDSDAVFVWPSKIKTWLPGLVGLNHQGIQVSSEKTAAFNMQSLQIRSGVISWVDQSVNPPALETITQVNLHLEAVSSDTPSAPTKTKLSAKVGEKGALQFEGEVYPFSSTPRFNLMGFIQSVELANISAYTRNVLDQRIEQGTVDASLKLTAENNRLNADTRWRFTDFDFEPTRRNTGQMPLELSFDLLRDHNNAVDVILPIKGDFSRDNLDLKYIFGTLMRRTINRMAVKEVNPSGAASVDARAKPASKVVFRPLLYATNERSPAELDLPRIEEIAEKLRAKPSMSLAFCTVSTGGEWSELFNQGQRPNAQTQLSDEQRQIMLDLAIARGRTVEALLLERGVNKAQVVLCQPELNMTQFGPSYTSVTQ